MSPDRRRLRASRSHLSSEAIVDLLEDRLSASRRAAAEEHLGLPCTACREKLREMGALLGKLSAGDLEAVPADLTRAAIGLFPAAPAEVASDLRPQPGWRLVFDSLAQPLAAATMRTVGEAHRLRFESDGAGIEIEAEPESAEQSLVRGRLEVASPELHRVIAMVGGERFEQWADSAGHFAFEGLPRGVTQLAIEGPDRTFDTPAFET